MNFSIIYNTKKLMYLIGLFVLVYILVGVLLYVKQRSFIYFPTGALPHDEKVVVFQNDAVHIHSILINAGKKEAIVYFGGNAETVANNIADFKRAFPNHSIYLIHYRGYGPSTGKPNEKALYSDALHIFDQISSSYDRISVIGRSLGSGVASYLASNRKISKLVLVTPFDSIERIAQGRFPVYPMSILLKDKYNSAGRVGEIQSDVLVLIAENDQVVPKKHTDNLIHSFVDKPVTTEIISGAGHNDISLDGRYYESISMFIDKNTNIK